MASITLGTFRDYLKAVADWANGLKEPKVQISGSSASEGGAPPAQILAVGGRYDATPRLLQSGQHGAIALSPEGRVIVEMIAQGFMVFNGTTVTAGATVLSPWVDVNGYSRLGIFVNFHPRGGGEPWTYRLRVSPTADDGVYAIHPDTVSPISQTGRPKAFIHNIGHARYIRFEFTNTDSVDVKFLRVWFQLIFA